MPSEEAQAAQTPITPSNEVCDIASIGCTEAVAADPMSNQINAANNDSEGEMEIQIIMDEYGGFQIVQEHVGAHIKFLYRLTNYYFIITF